MQYERVWVGYHHQSPSGVMLPPMLLYSHLSFPSTHAFTLQVLMYDLAAIRKQAAASSGPATLLQRVEVGRLEEAVAALPLAVHEVGVVGEEGGGTVRSLMYVACRLCCTVPAVLGPPLPQQLLG